MSFTSKRFNKFMATGATATVVATAIVPVVSADELTLSAFTDVAPQYEEAIDYVIENDIARGLNETQFGVKEEIIRGDAAIMIAQAIDLMNADAPESGFKDVPARGKLAVNSLKAAGVINGKTNNEFDFHSKITRGEAALMLANAYGLTANKESLVFTDVVGTRYDDAVSALVENEVTNGISATQFGTLKKIKRGDFAQFLYRLAEEQVEDTVPPIALTFLELNTPYVSSDNKMTVTMENLKIVDMGDFYEVQLTYKEQNNTTDQVIDQGAFKIFYASGESEPQYGFFNKLYPGEESTRNYTFKALKSQEILAIEYGADLFFKQQPTVETLKWNILTDK